MCTVKATIASQVDLLTDPCAAALLCECVDKFSGDDGWADLNSVSGILRRSGFLYWERGYSKIGKLFSAHEGFELRTVGTVQHVKRRVPQSKASIKNEPTESPFMYIKELLKV